MEILERAFNHGLSCEKTLDPLDIYQKNCAKWQKAVNTDCIVPSNMAGLLGRT